MSASARPDVASFAEIPEELRALPRWECYKIVGGHKVAVDPRTGTFAPEQGAPATFNEACACFVAHVDVMGLFFSMQKADPWRFIHLAEGVPCYRGHGSVTLITRIQPKFDFEAVTP
jgi:hypothetical protein